MSVNKKIFLIGGARPNFMKIAPLWHVMKDRAVFEPYVVHTGQHYDHEMSRVFFEQLELPQPHFFLDCGSGSQAKQTACVLMKTEECLMNSRPDAIIVVGDVNSTLAAALAAVKLHIPVAHVEAGLRSFDQSMPEEINRVLTDRISDLLFISEPSGMENLKNEGISQKACFLVGNTMIDSLKSSLEKIKLSSLPEELASLPESEYVVATFHRPSNVDCPENLEKILSLLLSLAESREIVFPVHPRTLKSFRDHSMSDKLTSNPSIHLTGPLGYFEFMKLVSGSGFVVTDSGGIQEETTFLGVPCFTFRDSTERPLTLDEGTNRLCSFHMEAASIIADAENFDKRNYSPPALWDGNAASRILDILRQKI